jgi:hypothetical protein
LTPPKKKQGHGPIPTYGIRSAKEKLAADEWAWLTAPALSARVYDSSLSKPGRICKSCRTFVGGGTVRCRSCWTTA